MLCAVLLLVAGSATAQPTHLRQRPPREAISTWAITRDADGAELTRTLVTRSFTFGSHTIGGHVTELLFLEEVQTTRRRSEEGDNGQVRIEAWGRIPPDTGYGTPLWTATLPGSTVRLVDNYYEVTQRGCCDTWDTRTLLSLATGRPLVRFTNGPIWLHGSDIGELRRQAPVGIVYLSGQGVGRLPALEADTLAFGELVLIEGDSIRNRIVLSGTTPNANPWASVEVAVVVGSDATREGWVTLSQKQRAVVRITSDDWAPILIPITGRRLSLDGATIPPAVRVHRMR
jgi:hypothetical protein